MCGRYLNIKSQHDAKNSTSWFVYKFVCVCVCMCACTVYSDLCNQVDELRIFGVLFNDGTKWILRRKGREGERDRERINLKIILLPNSNIRCSYIHVLCCIEHFLYVVLSSVRFVLYGAYYGTLKRTLCAV